MKITSHRPVKFLQGHYENFAGPAKPNDCPAKISLGMQKFLQGMRNALWNVLNMVIGLLGMWKYLVAL